MLKKLSTIVDDVDYWLYEWSATENNILRGHPLPSVTNAEKNRVKRNKGAAYFLFWTPTIPIIWGVLHWLLQKDWNLLFQIIPTVMAFVIISVVLLFLVEFMIDDCYFRVFNEKNLESLAFKLPVTQEQVEDVAFELNSLRKSGNKLEYMKIIDRLLEPDRRRREAEAAAKAEADKKIELERLKRNVHNPLLSGEIYSARLNELEAEIEEFKRCTNDAYSERLNEVNKALNDLVSGEANLSGSDRVAYNNIREELLKVTSSYNKSIANGGGLTPEQSGEYQRLLDNCQKVIEKIESSGLDSIVTDAKVSNMFLEEKYSLNS